MLLTTHYTGVLTTQIPEKNPQPQRGSVGNALNQTSRDQKAVSGCGADKGTYREGTARAYYPDLCLQIVGSDSQPYEDDPC